MKLPRSIASALYRASTPVCSSVPGPATIKMPEFKPKRILILSKVTRFEFEHKVHKGIHDAMLEQLLRRRGSNYENLRLKHQQHHDYVKMIQKELETAGIESRVVQRWDYNESVVDWADCIFSAGGDGTFLLAASRVRDPTKPVIGINTDPQGSEGYMCLMGKSPKEHFTSAVKKLLNGNFEWLFRQRIRITVTGEDGVGDPVELHDQQLNRNPATTRWTDNPRDPGESHSDSSTDHHDILPMKRSRNENGNGGEENRVTIELPYLALNEVYLGESLSSRVSYYEIQVDVGKMVKQKSSGITICTGTGSTSWYFNINKLTDQCVIELMKIVNDKCKVNLPIEDKEIVSDICGRFNEHLIFEPDLQKMAFSIRDPVFNATFPPAPQRGFAQNIRVKSRGYDAHLVIDGGVSYRFNDGAEAVLEVHKEDCLRTVVFR